MVDCGCIAVPMPICTCVEQQMDCASDEHVCQTRNHHGHSVKARILTDGGERLYSACVAYSPCATPAARPSRHKLEKDGNDLSVGADGGAYTNSLPKKMWNLSLERETIVESGCLSLTNSNLAH